MNNNFLKTKKTLIIGELSCNHLGHFDIAVKTIEAMKECGVDIVKVQNDKADGGITINCDNEYFKINGGTLWDGETLYSLYKKTDTPWEWLPKLQKISHDLGMDFFSSPSDLSGVDYLESLNVPAYKVASFEITDIPLIKKMASTHKPIIISTGIANDEDVKLAIETCRKENNNQIMLMKCVSSYPAPLDSINLLALPEMKRKYNCEVGLSDHSSGDIVALTAVALGAKIIEKHFILDRMLGGPDAAFSMEPEEFKCMVKKIREVEKCLGNPLNYFNNNIENSRRFAKSIFVTENVKKGDLITEDNISCIRPGYGLHPKYYSEVLGKKFCRDIERGIPFDLTMIYND